MNSHLASNCSPNLNLLAFVHAFGKGDGLRFGEFKRKRLKKRKKLF